MNAKQSFSLQPLWVACVALLCALPAAAQEEPEAEAGSFFEQISVNVVNVEVYVTDREGNPVLGLTRDDFEIREDDHPVELVNFYRVADGRPTPDEVVDEASTESPTEPEADTPTIEIEQEADAELAQSLREIEARNQPVFPDAQRLHLIVYVDNFNIHPLNRNRVFGRLTRFLHEILQPGDEVMVASYDRSLHIRHPFTRDAAAVNRALDELQEFSGMALEREAEREDAVRKIYETESVHTALWEAKQFSDNQEHELDNALDALEEMLDSLAGLPGRKMLIHLSDGIAMVPGQDLYQAIQQRFADRSALGLAHSRDRSRRYMSLIARANSNRITFYTIDASGLETRAMGAESQGVNSPLTVSSTIGATRARNLQGPLFLMADRTGGRAIVNTNDVSQGLERIRTDLSNYYSLGYRAPVANRGRYHKIEVRLTDPKRGWTLRHREGYRDKSVETEVSDGVRAFLVHGYETNPLDVKLDVGEQGPRDADGFVNVAIRVRVPIERIALLPRQEFHEGRLRLYFSAADPEGRDAPLQELPFELRVPDSSVEAAKQDEMVRVINATMRPGAHKLVVAVRDEITGEQSFVGRWLTVGM